MSKGDTDERIRSALNDLGLLESLVSSSQIPGDLSPRRYYRCVLSKEITQLDSSTVMAMVFDSIIPPESETKLVYTSDVAFLELAVFFEDKGIAVPRIILDRKDIGVILLEDLGNETLINRLKNQSETALEYYSEACNVIKTIQSIPYDETYFAFNRALEEDLFKRETESFKNYFLAQARDEGHKKKLEECIALVCKEVSEFERVLVHRDFHSWNLLIDKSNKLRIIDFQDALMGPRTYDLVALLHERDIDYILTKDQILKLEEQYFSFYSDPKVREYEYPRVQLQRDIKTTGLFKRCVVERGLLSYGEWIPGNLKRMQLTLSELSRSDSRYGIFFDYVCELGVN